MQLDRDDDRSVQKRTRRGTSGRSFGLVVQGTGGCRWFVPVGADHRPVASS
jgi:hypothetical protein